jgi:hypothetical protein
MTTDGRLRISKLREGRTDDPADMETPWHLAVYAPGSKERKMPPTWWLIQEFRTWEEAVQYCTARSAQ